MSSLASWHLNVEVHFLAVFTLVHSQPDHIDYFIYEFFASVTGHCLFIWHFGYKCVCNRTWMIELSSQRFEDGFDSPGVGALSNDIRVAIRFEM